MWWAVLGAVAPVIAGLALGSTPRIAHALVHRARPIAVFVTLAVIVLDLLPHAWESLGALSLAVFAAGLVLPLALERGVGALPGAGAAARRAADELAFAILVLHQLGDGLQVGSAAAIGEWAVVAAVAVHSVPLVAVVTLRYAADDDGVLWPRAIALLLATATGAAAGVAVAASLPGHGGWLPALLGGVLLHVLWHDFPEHHHHE